MNSRDFMENKSLRTRHNSTIYHVVWCASLFPVNISPCPVLSAILCQLCVPCDRLQNGGREDIDFSAANRWQPKELIWNANLMKQGNFIHVFLARHVSGTYAHHQEHTRAHTTYAAALKTTTHPKTRCRKPYAATQHPLLLMMGVCTRNMSS